MKDLKSFLAFGALLTLVGILHYYQEPVDPENFMSTYVEEIDYSEYIFKDSLDTEHAEIMEEQDASKDTEEDAVENLKNNVSLHPKEEAKKIYELTEVDIIPHFGPHCNRIFESSCSEKNMESFIKENVARVQSESPHSLINVEFVVDEKGKLSTVKHVWTYGPQVKFHAQAAVNIVAEMKEWRPGIINGKPVPVRMEVSVEFKNSDIVFAL